MSMGEHISVILPYDLFEVSDSEDSDFEHSDEDSIIDDQQLITISVRNDSEGSIADYESIDSSTESVHLSSDEINVIGDESLTDKENGLLAFPKDLTIYSAGDEEYLESSRNVVGNFFKISVALKLNGVFKDSSLLPSCRSQHLQILNHFILNDKNILAFLDIEHLLSVMEFNPDTTEITNKTVQLLLRNLNFLSLKAKIKVLLLFSKYANDPSIMHMSPILLQKLLINLMHSLYIIKGMNTYGDSTEEVVFHLHAMFVKLIGSSLMQCTVNDQLIGLFVNLLKKNNSKIQIRMKLIEILAIICAESNTAPKVLMKLQIEKTLRNIECSYKFNGEAINLPYITLIWSMLPSLPDTVTYERNDEVRKQYENECSFKIWRTEIRKGLWIPFEPKLNYEINRTVLRAQREYTFVQGDVLKTIDLARMAYINEATSKRRSISCSDCDINTVTYIWKKRKCAFISYKLGETFIKFALPYVTNRISVTTIVLEKFFCLESLLIMLPLLSESEHREYFFHSSPNGELWTADRLVGAISKESNSPNSDLKMLALQILRVLMTPPLVDLYGDILRDYAVLPPIKPTQENRVRLPSNSGNLGISDLTTKETKLEEIKKSLHDKSTRLVCHRESINFLLGFLTESTTEEEKIARMRKFLKVFANIAEGPENVDIEITRGPFRKLINIISQELDLFEYTSNLDIDEKRQFGINTIAKLSKKRFNIVFVNSRTSRATHWYKVRPFATVQYLEAAIFTILRKRRYEGLTKVSSLVYIMEMYLNDQLLPPEITVFEAIRRFDVGDNQNLFKKKYHFKYSLRYIEHGPCPVINSETHVIEHYLRVRPTSNVESLSANLIKALHLMDVLYGVNRHWTEVYPWIHHREDIIDPEQFIHHGLDHLLNIYMRDPFKALIGNLPRWTEYMIESCPFIFTLKTRKFALRIYSLDRRRSMEAILKRDVEYNYSMFLSTRYLNVSIDRKMLWPYMEEMLVGSRAYSIWGITFKGEIGEGPGLKREFFTLTGRLMQRAHMNIWSSRESTDTGYVVVEEGLYPAAVWKYANSNEEMDADRTFGEIGMLLAKSVIEETVVDLPLAPTVFNWLLDKETILNHQDMKYVNPAVSKVLEDLENFATERERILEDDSLSAGAKTYLLQKLSINGYSLKEYDINFVLPGHDDIEIIPGGADIQVTADNVRLYVQGVTRLLLKEGVKRAMESLRRGFNHYIPLKRIRLLQPDELMILCCGQNDDQYWSMEHLRRYIALDNCTVETPMIKNLFEVLNSFSEERRKQFLQFTTGSARLPVGGFASLTPEMKVVCCENPYPTAHTCFNEFRVPVNFTKDNFDVYFSYALTEGLNYYGFV